MRRRRKRPTSRSPGSSSRGSAWGSARGSAWGCLFGVSLVIVLACAAIAARKPIEAAIGKLFGGGAQAVPQVVVGPLSEKEKSAPPAAPRPSTEDAGKNMEGGPPPAGGPASPGIQPVTPSTQGAQEKPTFRKARLFFASVDQNGKILLKGVIRPIPSSDSPLSDTLQSLLAGPSAQELGMGLLSMIPSSSKLKGVVVHGDTAFLDFNESFRFNTLGREGLNAQLEQVVYAATEFPTVKKVQILIEGNKVPYLGAESIRIDSPLDRQSFPD